MVKWFLRDAEWYEFWLPQSGFFGGLFLGTIAGIIIVVGYFVFGR